jgi:hypothetical protein
VNVLRAALAPLAAQMSVAPWLESPERIVINRSREFRFFFPQALRLRISACFDINLSVC